MTRDQLRHYMAALRGSVGTKEKLHAADTVEVEFAALLEVLGLLALCEPAALRAKAQDLQRVDRESWVIGKIVEKALDFLERF